MPFGIATSASEAQTATGRQTTQRTAASAQRVSHTKCTSMPLPSRSAVTFLFAPPDARPFLGQVEQKPQAQDGSARSPAEQQACIHPQAALISATCTATGTHATRQEACECFGGFSRTLSADAHCEEVLGIAATEQNSRFVLSELTTDRELQVLLEVYRELLPPGIAAAIEKLICQILRKEVFLSAESFRERIQAISESSLHELQRASQIGRLRLLSQGWAPQAKHYHLDVLRIRNLGRPRFKAVAGRSKSCARMSPNASADHDVCLRIQHISLRSCQRRSTRWS